MGGRLARAAALLTSLLCISLLGADSALDIASKPEPAARAVRVEGTRLVGPGGKPFEWRGVTAFALLRQLADGREREAVAFMRWARNRGFNVVRVVTMAKHLFRLDPADGVEAVPRLLRLAGELGLVVELVAFADTRALRPDLEAHVDAIARAIDGAPNVVVELANENDHSSQDPRLTDGAFLQALRVRLPRDVPVSLGSLHGGDMRVERWTGGDYVTIHVSRSLGPWEHVAATATLASLAKRAGKPVIGDEPIGAGERVEPRRRLTDPAVFFGLGVMAHMSEVPTTFHCSDCLHARVPGPRQQASAAAFVEGMRLLPEGRRFSLVPAGEMLARSPVPGVAAVHAARDETGEWVIVATLGAREGLILPWASGWAAEVLAKRPGIAVFRARSSRRAASQAGADGLR